VRTWQLHPHCRRRRHQRHQRHQRHTTYGHSCPCPAELFIRILARLQDVAVVAAIVTDNAASMRLARDLLAAVPEYKHILPLRCFMHAYGLVMGTALAHPYAQDTVTKAQKFVNYFKSSHRAKALLAEMAGRCKVSTGLASSNQTRMTSIHMCLESLLRLQPAFTILLLEEAQRVQVQRPQAGVQQGQPPLFDSRHQDTKKLLQDAGWWAQVKQISDIMQPFSQVIMAVQGDCSSLADVSRYWAYLAHQLQVQLPTRLKEGGSATEYALHVARGFNRHHSEMASPVCRLALMLDPRYKAGVKSTINTV
jgi:hypothetical protein